MNYWHRLLSESWLDTWDLVVGKSLAATFVAGFLVFFLTLTIHWFRKEHHDFWAKIKSIVVALVATAGALFIVFLCHALLLTPKKIVARYQIAEKKARDELLALRQAGPNEQQVTDSEPTEPTYQLESLAEPRTVRTVAEMKIEGRISNEKSKTENALSGASFAISRKRVTECQILEVTKGIPTKLRRSFVEATSNMTILLRDGKKSVYDDKSPAHGKVITEELVRNEPSKREWNRNLDNGTGSSAERRWMASLPVPEEWEETIPWSQQVGDTWVVGPVTPKDDIDDRHARGAKLVPFDDPNYVQAGERITTNTFLKIESLRGVACALLHHLESVDLTVTILPTNSTFRGRGLFTGRCYRSLQQRVDVQDISTGFIAGDFFGVPFKENRLDGSFSANFSETIEQTVLD